MAITEMSAVEMVAAFKRGALSPLEAARACLAQIERHNETVNAYCLVDAETTLSAAKASEQRYQKNAPLGPVDGVPTAIKDVFLTTGWPTLKGSKTIDPEQPWEVDAPVVAALKRNGFVPLGKTTTPELGWKGVTDSPLCGATNNPWNAARTAGGSSGGSAAAVALGMGPLALGTDAGGSIRIPAAFCGVFGLKPTWSRVPFFPGSPFGFLAHAGPMTWSVSDAALMMNVISAWDSRDSQVLPPDGVDYLTQLDAGVKGWKIAYSADLGYVDVDPQIAAAVAAAAKTFETLGASVDAVDPGFEDPKAAFECLFYSGAANAIRNFTPQQRGKMDPGLVAVAEQAANYSMLDYLGAVNHKVALSERMSLFFDRYDLLLTPTLPIAAFATARDVPEHWAHPHWPSWTPFTYPFNMTGQPAASVPCGFTADGLPIGLQIVAGRFGDKRILQAAHAYQKVSGLVKRPPGATGLKCLTVGSP